MLSLSAPSFELVPTSLDLVAKIDNRTSGGPNYETNPIPYPDSALIPARSLAGDCGRYRKGPLRRAF